jgi:hypothetical protein
MVGVPPQSANEREREDRMDEFYGELETIYTRDLLNLVRWSLMLDPLQRPQSVFALQKAMRLLPDPAQAPDTLLSRLQKMVN